MSLKGRWREKREGAVKRGEERRGLTWVVKISGTTVNRVFLIFIKN